MKFDLYLFKNQQTGPVKWAVEPILAEPTGAAKCCSRESLAFPSGPRLSASLTSYNDGEAIFLSGGQDNKRLATVEYYRPNNDSWANAPDLNFERTGHSSCSLKDKIYVFGGVADPKSMKTIEWLDVATLFQSLKQGDYLPKWVCYRPRKGQIELPELVSSLFCPINDE